MTYKVLKRPEIPAEAEMAVPRDGIVEIGRGRRYINFWLSNPQDRAIVAAYMSEVCRCIAGRFFDEWIREAKETKTFTDKDPFFCGQKYFDGLGHEWREWGGLP